MPLCPRLLYSLHARLLNVRKQSFALVKQWQRLATRYAKLAIAYRASPVPQAELTWATLFKKSRLIVSSK